MPLRSNPTVRLRKTATSCPRNARPSQCHNRRPKQNEVEARISFAPKMRRTKWSPHKPDRMAQFEQLTDEVQTPWLDHLPDCEMKQAYAAALEKQLFEDWE